MIGFLQRVTQAAVAVEGQKIAQIGSGLMVLVGVQPLDNQVIAKRLLQRLLHYRVFADADGRMNLSLKDRQAGLLLVPQFTLAADTRKGLRPGFQTAAGAELGLALFTYLVDLAQTEYPHVESGRFGADMQVSLVNDGPVSFWLEVS